MTWQYISPEVTLKGFKKCCISSAVEGTMICCGMITKRMWVLALNVTKDENGKSDTDG
jgi:hypothetical protein